MGIFNHKTFTLGADLSALSNSLGCFGPVARRTFDYAILDIRDISKTIGILKNRGRRFTSLYAHITSRKPYCFNGAEKDPLTAAAIIYDFVDGFVISDFGSNIAKTVDPLLNLRLINDEYREIYLQIPAHYGPEDLDRMLEYVRYSNIDGLLLGNEKHFGYIDGKCAGALKLLIDSVSSPREYDELIQKGAKAVFIKAEGKTGFLYFLKGILFRMKSKL